MSARHFSRSLLILGLLFPTSALRASTAVTLGSVKSFAGPDDPNLDLNGDFAYAINFSPDDPVRTVNGLPFRPDNQGIPGATLTGPQNVVSWQNRPEFGSSADANALELILHDIRWANAGNGEKLQARLAVEAGVLYKIQILISGNIAENRRWDIRFNGLAAVDEITSLGVNPGQNYSPNRSTVWAHEFVPSTSTVTVEMGNFFGANDGGDRNPIWQALTLERVYIPPTPDNISLAADQFFPSQSDWIGDLTVTDGKYQATHTLSLVSGPGSTDNAKFSISGNHLLPAPYDFSSDAPGTVYLIRVRATDAADGTRVLEKTFPVTLSAPHPPTGVNLNATSLSSGLIAGQSTGILQTEDEDGFDRHVFALVSGPGSSDNGLFVIVGNELRLASALPAGMASVSLRVRATDLAGLTVESVIVLPVVEPRVRLNEVLAVSTPASRPLDQDSQPQDWIELYNELAQPVNMAGWHLSDNPDNPAKWTFPAASIPPNGYLLVFASGTGASYPDGPLHTNFSLRQSGERLILTRPDGVIASTFDPPEFYPDGTWGVAGGGTETGYLRTPTPEAANSPLAMAGRNDVAFSVPHGFKSASFPLTLSATVPGSVIRYTLDGSVPTASSPVYSTPLTITPVAGTTKSGTRIVRAVASHPDAAWAPVTTQTYFFVNGVTSPTVDGVVGQSNFVSSIRNNATYGPLLDDALLALPAVSLVINDSAGLPFSETESSLELVDPAGGEPGFTVPAGVVRSGTSSLGYAKGSMSARFRGEYGATSLDYPLFARHPYAAEGAARTFQEIRLRSGSHDTLSWLGTAENPPVPYGSPSVTRSGDAQFVRNIWIEDMQFLMGQPGKHGRMVQMFVNGNYYGMYHIQEHADDDYMASYYPGSADDYHFTGAATTGSQHGSESWSSIWGQIKASLGNYTQAQRWIDMKNLADYMILSFYAGNDWDWWTTHNWGAAGPRLPDAGGWKFFQQDQDISLQDVNADCTDQAVPDGIFAALMNHADFKVLFRDRVYRHLYHDGVLTPAKAGAYYTARTDEIFTAIVAETARWQPTSSVGPLPWDRDGEWTVEKNYLTNTFFPQRTAKLLSQLRARGWYPVEAPEMTQQGGTVAPGTRIGLTAPAGTIYYTTDGSDPRLPGGAVSPAAVAYNSSTSTVTLAEANDGRPGRGAVWKYLVSATDPGTSWRDTAFDDSAWPAGAVEAGYGESDETTDVGYVDTDPGTVGEQRNITTCFRHTFLVDDPSAIVGLTIRIRRDDGAVVYLNGREVMRSAMPAGEITFTTPGNNGVNVPDDGNTWFSQVLAPAQYSLNAGANTIAVEIHNASASSSDITFDLELTATAQVSPQPLEINAAGLVRIRTRTSAGEWSGLNEAAFILTGTVPAATENLTVTEIHYNPDGEGQGDAEFLEFQNTSAVPVDVSGVQLSGAITFTFPAGLVLQPGEFVVAVKDPSLFAARYSTPGSPWYRAGIRVAGAWSGSLSNGGEFLTIKGADSTPVSGFAWSDSSAWPGRADGHGSSLELIAPLTAPATLAEKNAWLGDATNWRSSSEFHGSPGYAGSGPDNRVVVNELLAASLPPQVDFIELLNTTGTPQAVGGWFLSDTPDDYHKFRIAPGTVMLPGGYLVLTENEFNNPADPGVLTPFALSSAGDDVYLLEADAGGNLLRFVDRVEFDGTPGGMTVGRFPDGTGPAELLRTPTSGGTNAAAIPEYGEWITAQFPQGSPGADTALSADPDGDGLVNLLEFVFGLSPLHPDGSPVTLLPADGDSPLQFRYTIRSDVAGLSARPEVSTDLSTWDTSGTQIDVIRETPGENGLTTVIAQLKPDPGKARRSVRIHVSL